MANSIIYSGGDGGWSNNINKIIYSGPITNANIIYCIGYANIIYNNKKWAKYNSINVPNNRVGGVQYKNKNKWANINNNLLKIKAIYNSINVLNKWANINTLYNKVGGLINNIKKYKINWTIKYIKGANSILNLIKINWTKYNLKNINNKGIRIGPTHNIKFKKYKFKKIKYSGLTPLKNLI